MDTQDAVQQIFGKAKKAKTFHLINPGQDDVDERVEKWEFNTGFVLFVEFKGEKIMGMAGKFTEQNDPDALLRLEALIEMWETNES